MEEARTGARDVPVERHASQLELQLEQVQLTLQQLRQTQGSLHEMETRLADMTRECADILDRWAKNDEKHAAAVVELHGRLSEWSDVERRLLNESATRVHQFERSLQHEWNALKQKHELPLQQLEAQGVRIAETCITAVEQALKGFDKAEARLAAIESNLQREMGALTVEVRGALAEVRGALAEMREGQALGARQPWSLDNVVRLHNELRTDDGGGSAPALAAATGTLGLAPAAMRAPRALEAARLGPAPESSDGPLEHAVPAESRAATTAWRLAPIVGIVLLAVAGVGYGLYLHGRLSAGLNDAAARAEAAERDAAASRTQASQEIAAVREAADARLASAEHAAAAAQLLASIVASPDAKRFDLIGSAGSGPAVQVLWSRSRGVAASAGPLPALPAGRIYQLWLVTRGGPVSAGLLPASPERPTNAVFPWPADLRRAVVGAMITIEPEAGSRQPTGPAWLVSRAPTTPPPAPPAAGNGS
jgi:hypothetical protein